MKTQEDQLDALLAIVEKRLTALESSVSHMKSKLAELHDVKKEAADTETFRQVV